MTNFKLRLAAVCVLCLIGTGFSVLAWGQGPATGVPPFASVAGGPGDSVNLSNLNIHIDVPVVRKAGRRDALLLRSEL